jgi:hypothetical protein
MIDNEQKRILAAMILSGCAHKVNSDNHPELRAESITHWVTMAIALTEALCTALPDPEPPPEAP